MDNLAEFLATLDPQIGTNSAVEFVQSTDRSIWSCLLGELEQARLPF